MSGTAVSAVATPAVAPAVPTSAKADYVVAISGGLAQLVAIVKANPEVLTYLEQQFGTQLATMAHTTGGSIIGLILGGVFARFGIQADQNLTLALCGAGVVIGSIIWNGVVAIWRRLSTRMTQPPQPVTVSAPPTVEQFAQAVVDKLKLLSHPPAPPTPPTPAA